MATPRFFSPIKLSIGQHALLSENAATHATRVLRLKVGDSLTLFNGDGYDYFCELISLKKSEVMTIVKAQHLVNNVSCLNIQLLQGISSGERMDYTIQKAVELGVNSIQPLATERSVVKLNQDRAEKRLHHWQNIAISACEQCGRALIPQVHAPLAIAEWLSRNPANNITRIQLNPIGAKKLSELTKPTGEIQLLIGAEGGLSAGEIKLVSQHNFHSVVLGPRILRTETAALSAIAAMQTLWGDF